MKQDKNLRLPQWPSSVWSQFLANGWHRQSWAMMLETFHTMMNAPRHRAGMIMERIGMRFWYRKSTDSLLKQMVTFQRMQKARIAYYRVSPRDIGLGDLPLA